MFKLDRLLVPKRGNKSETKPIILDGMRLAESSGVLRVDQIANFINFETNQVIANPIIERYSSSEIIEPHQLFKRICCLDSDYEFEVYGNIDELEQIADEEFTVFKAPTSGIRKSGTPGDFVEMDLMIPTSSEEGPSAHEPLDLGDPTFGQIDGHRGFLLAQEYQRPWNLTANKNTIMNNGGMNVARFNSNGVSFERVDRYEYSKAHNFESMLSAMIEKYGMSFFETAKRMEDMYLSSK